uniref:Uncharacterized protein n=1 Tax=Salix viminalis TaxID=40686 RepID=A0A6N2M090_SALVM
MKREGERERCVHNAAVYQCPRNILRDKEELIATTFMGDGDAVAAKKAGKAVSTQVRRIIKTRMLNLDNFNYNTITLPNFLF